MNTVEAAQGRWREILPALGIPAAVLDGKHHKCPCGVASTDAFRFDDHEGRGGFFCKCSHGGNGIKLVQCHLSCDFKTAACAVDKVLDRVSRPEPKPQFRPMSFEFAYPARSKYLESRGLEIAPGLRWTKRAKYVRDDTTHTFYPAMLAPISDAAGNFARWQALYLNDGAKAQESPSRKTMPGNPWQGGACRLYPVDGEQMGVAEGVETAISAKMLFNTPVWAAINAGNLAKFVPPPNVKELTIFADWDANLVGHAAAYTLAARLLSLGTCRVVVKFPRAIGDFNDQLLGKI